MCDREGPIPNQFKSMSILVSLDLILTAMIRVTTVRVVAVIPPRIMNT